jgi:membrane protein
VTDGGDHWVLLANVNKLTLAEVYRLFVFAGMSINAGVVSDSDDERDIQAARDAAALARRGNGRGSGAGQDARRALRPNDPR